jgi:hypothetical protein
MFLEWLCHFSMLWFWNGLEWLQNAIKQFSFTDQYMTLDDYFYFESIKTISVVEFVAIFM